jgi:mannose-6-phosphate isomerase-like protein (cupin superfamily)
MDSQGAGFEVAAGTDREGQNQLMIWGLLPLANKVSGKDTDGQFYAFEHRDIMKGGPPRHVHFAQDEWFYVIKGRFAFEVGEHRATLGAGDTMFAPRKIPHGWSCVEGEPGTLLTIVSPVNGFEKFLMETTQHATLPSAEEIAKAFKEYDMEVVGPPLESD